MLDTIRASCGDPFAQDHLPVRAFLFVSRAVQSNIAYGASGISTRPVKCLWLYASERAQIDVTYDPVDETILTGLNGFSRGRNPLRVVFFRSKLLE
jgi:hypothetical protein